MSFLVRSQISILLLLVGPLPSPQALAGVHACVFDGGGSTWDSLCGRSEYINTVHRAYAGQRITTENVFSGDGNDPAPDCKPKYFDPNLPLACEGSQEVSQQVSPSKYGLPETHNSSLPESSPLTQNYQLKPASTQNFGSCLPSKTANPPSEVCHLWTANHGLSGGAITAYGGGAIDPGSFSRAISSNSACATTRFITNNCHSGAMAKAIFDSSGRVRPGVCGVSATPASAVARGMTTQIGTVQSQKGEVALTGIIYNFTDEIAKSLEKQKKEGKTPTLDHAFADAYLHDPMDEIPQSTSQFYLDARVSKAGSPGTIEQSFENACQLAKVLGTNPLSTQADALFTSVRAAAAKSGVDGVDTLSAAEQEKARREISLQKQRLLEFERAICSRNYPGECTPQSAAGFIQSKLDAAYNDPVSKNYSAMKEARKQYAEEDSRITEIRTARFANLTAAESSVRTLTSELEKLERKYSQNYIGGVDGRVSYAQRKLEEAGTLLQTAKGKEEKAAAQQKVDQAQTAYTEAQTAKVAYAAAREETLKRLAAAKESVSALHSAGPDELAGQTQVQKLSQKVRELEVAMEVNKDALAPRGGFRAVTNECGSDGGSSNSGQILEEFRKYKRLRDLHDQTLKLFAEGTQEQIRGYMTVRDCETSPFTAQAPGVGPPAASPGAAR